MATFLASLVLSSGTQTAVANGDTRTIYLFHVHTKETIAATFRVNGQYDPAVLKQLNWFLRDWRRDEPTSMDPRLFDVVWEVYRSAGAGTEPVTVMSAYRSPETNAMLRRRSRAVAEHSQHMLGKAMDTSMPGMSMEQIREVGMRLQRGGVGYYPTAGTPFVHLDVGSVRSWPRMGYDQLVRLFPDGKTVHLPSNGQPLARYEEARAEIAAGGASAPPSSRSTGFFAWLFGSGSGGGAGGGDDEDSGVATAPAPRTQVASRRGGRGNRGAIQMASADASSPASAYASTGGDDAGRDFFASQAARRSVPATTFAQAESDLPRGETFVAPSAPKESPVVAQAALAPSPAAPSPLPPRTVVASLETVDDATGTTNSSVRAQESVPSAFADHPIPPRRPVDLASFEVPLPPSRPVALAAFSRTLGTPAAAYASVEPSLRRNPITSLLDREMAGSSGPAALRLTHKDSPPVVPARLDHSNFRAMTAQQPTAHMTTQTSHGAVVIGLRSAARANAAMTSPVVASAGSFEADAGKTGSSGFVQAQTDKTAGLATHVR